MMQNLAGFSMQPTTIGDQITLPSASARRLPPALSRPGVLPEKACPLNTLILLSSSTEFGGVIEYLRELGRLL